MLEDDARTADGFCNICAHEWSANAADVDRTIRFAESANRDLRTANRRSRFRVDRRSDRRTGIRRDELATLAEIGALNAFGYDRRSALWQIEQAVRPAGELFEELPSTAEIRASSARNPRPATSPERADRGRSGRGFAAPADDAVRAADGRLFRHEPDDRAASDGAAAAGAGAARRAARERLCRAGGMAGASGWPAR